MIENVSGECSFSAQMQYLFKLTTIPRNVGRRLIALPVGRFYKVRERPPSSAVPNEVLETVYRRNGKILPSHAEILVSNSVLHDYFTYSVQLALFLDPEGGSQKATLVVVVVLLVVGISSLKISKAFLIRSRAHRTFVLTLPTDLPPQIFNLFSN